MLIVCWIPEATNTHWGRVIRTDFQLQHWLHEHASMLRYARIASLVLIWSVHLHLAWYKTFPKFFSCAVLDISPPIVSHLLCRNSSVHICLSVHFGSIWRFPYDNSTGDILPTPLEHFKFSNFCYDIELCLLTWRESVLVAKIFCLFFTVCHVNAG